MENSRNRVSCSEIYGEFIYQIHSPLELWFFGKSLKTIKIPPKFQWCLIFAGGGKVQFWRQKVQKSPNFYTPYIKTQFWYDIKLELFFSKPLPTRRRRFYLSWLITGLSDGARPLTAWNSVPLQLWRPIDENRTDPILSHNHHSSLPPFTKIQLMEDLVSWQGRWYHFEACSETSAAQAVLSEVQSGSK
jgi:hypothetical protein